MKPVVVVGGGIAGLSAAYALHKQAAERGYRPSITVLEKEPRWGGKIITRREAGFVIEGGPDTFLATKPWAVDLCRELGLGDRLHGTNPAINNTYILHRRELQPIPGGLTMMIPTRFAPLLRSRLLSWPGKARMGLDLVLPPGRDGQDESLGAFISRRLGRQAYERLIEPLMSGIYAGDGDQLSLGATLPYLRDLERKHGGLVRGALAMRRAMGAKANHDRNGRSVFLTPTTGLAEMVEALETYLEDAGVDLRSGTGARRLVPDREGYRVETWAGERLPARGVILAAPAFVAAGLLRDMDPRLAAELEAIPYVSTATVSLAYRLSDLPAPLDGYGYVIPRREGRQALACTWTSTKFPHRAPEGMALLRVFIGRAGQEGDIPWDHDSLEAIARAEVRQTLGIAADPQKAWVYRWERAMPQYNVGHLARLARLEERLGRWSGLKLAGSGYRGIGIPDCIHSGQQAAERVLAVLVAEHEAMLAGV